MMWKVEPFVKAMNYHGRALIPGKVGYYPVSKWSSIIIKTDQDFKLANYALKAIESGEIELEYIDLTLRE